MARQLEEGTGTQPVTETKRSPHMAPSEVPKWMIVPGFGMKFSCFFPGFFYRFFLGGKVFFFFV